MRLKLFAKVIANQKLALSQPLSRQSSQQLQLLAMPTFYSFRHKIWQFASRNHPQNMILTPPLALLRAILWPKAALLSWLHKDCGYSLWTNSWIIHGVEFSDSFFRSLATQTPEGRCFVVKRDKNVFNGKTTVYTHYYNLVSDPVTGKEFARIDNNPFDACHKPEVSACDKT